MKYFYNFRDDDRLNFNFVAPMASADGYGYSAEELVRFAVQEHNANIGYIAHDWVDDRYTGEDVKSLKIAREDIELKEVVVVYFIPYAFYHFQANVTLGQTMFETTEIPDVWAAFCHHTEGLIVPSEFCKEVFQKKVDRPIEVAPLGVNTQTYFYQDREPSSVFTFLMAGLLHYRKGAEFAVKAFKQEFEKDEPVRLILKTRRGFFDIGSERIDDPRIQVIDADYSRSDMLNLYHAGDCFIACSRGEASGLTPREAMATGLPAIVTNWGGLSEIADPRYTYPLDIEGLEDAPAVCSSYDEGITQGQPIGQFSRPSIDHLRRLMREAYENKEATKKKGFDAAMWIQSNWNYSVCSKQWLTAIEKVYDNRHSLIHNS